MCDLFRPFLVLCSVLLCVTLVQSEVPDITLNININYPDGTPCVHTNTKTVITPLPTTPAMPTTTHTTVMSHTYSVFRHPQLLTGLALVSYNTGVYDYQLCATACDKAGDECAAFLHTAGSCQLLAKSPSLYATNLVYTYVYKWGDQVHTRDGAKIEILGFRTSEDISDKPAAIYSASADSGDINAAVDLSTKLTTTTYKHPIMEKLAELPIDKINLMFRDANGGLKKIVFRGNQADKSTWLFKDRLESSPWTHLKNATTNFFSLNGDGKHKRHFFINHHYGGCGADSGWFILSHGPCTWESRYKVSTVILYSKLNTFVNWNQFANVGRATDLLVTVEMTV